VRRVLARVLATASLLLAIGCGDDEPPARSADPLVTALQRGGHTLVLRHARTDATTDRRERLGSCAQQRNLTAAGREQARAMGRAIRELRIPLGDVRASPLCRTRETAELAFGRAALDLALVTPGVVGTAADDAARGRRLRRRVAREDGRGANDVLVTHTGTLREAFGTLTETIAEGEAFVFGRGGRLVGRIEAERWAELVP
jgi:broad specificity phosphatase PhoE